MEGADFLKLEELILLAIAGKSEIYGLEIATEIAKASEDKVQLNYGSLYPYLNRLEKKGYISSRWEEENERKGARRKYYQITDKGTQSLDEATLIRQRLRQQSDVPIIITSQIQPDGNIEAILSILQHPEEKERMQAIYKLECEAKIDPAHYWKIMKVLANFVRTNSPIDKNGTTEPDIQAALDVIGKRKKDQNILFESIDLSKINLEGANLEGANLKGANLKGANLEGVNLEGANLEGVNLVRANLKGANLKGANLKGANLQGANFGGVNLKESKNLTVEQLHSARNWEQAYNIPDLKAE